jgi:hypothetical protein
MQDQLPADVREALAELELGAACNRAEAQRAYRDLIQVWHPDRFATRPTLLARASAKTQRLNIARDVLVRWFDAEAAREEVRRQDAARRQVEEEAVRKRQAEADLRAARRKASCAEEAVRGREAPLPPPSASEPDRMRADYLESQRRGETDELIDWCAMFYQWSPMVCFVSTVLLIALAAEGLRIDAEIRAGRIDLAYYYSPYYTILSVAAVVDEVVFAFSSILATARCLVWLFP